MNGNLEIEIPPCLEELKLERFVSDAAVIDGGIPSSSMEEDEQKNHLEGQDAADAAAKKRKDARRVAGRRRSSGASILSVLRKLRRESGGSAASGAWIDMLQHGSDELMSSIEFSYGETSYDDSIVTSLLLWDETELLLDNDSTPQLRRNKSFSGDTHTTPPPPLPTLMDTSEGTTESRWHNGSNTTLMSLAEKNNNQTTSSSPVVSVINLLNEQWPLREQNNARPSSRSNNRKDRMMSDDSIPKLTSLRQSETSLESSSRWHSGSSSAIDSLTRTSQTTNTTPLLPVGKLMNEQWPLKNTGPAAFKDGGNKNDATKRGTGVRVSRTDRIKANKLSGLVAASLRDDCPFLIQRQPTKTPDSSTCGGCNKGDKKPSLIQRNSTKSTACRSCKNKEDKRPCLIHRQSTKSTTTTNTTNCPSCSNGSKGDKKPCLIQRNSTKSTTCRSCDKGDKRPCLIHRNSTKSSAGQLLTSGEKRRGDLHSLAE